MPNYRRADAKGGTYFFTVVTYRRQRILCNENVRDALRAGIRDAQGTHPFTIDGWVLLPDHLHCIWTLPPDDADFGIRWAKIKRFVTKQCGPDLQRVEWLNESKQRRKESTIWQRRFWEHQIRDERDFRCSSANTLKKERDFWGPIYFISMGRWPHAKSSRLESALPKQELSTLRAS